MGDSDQKTATIERTLVPGQELEDCRITVVVGPDAGRSVPVTDGRLLVGSKSSCDLRLSDPTVSGMHAEFTVVPGGIRVRDLGSTNGTLYMGTRIDRAVIQPGALITVGKSQLAVAPPTLAPPEPLADTSYGPLEGHGARMGRLFSWLQRIEPTTVTVLLQGETGTGKSLVAQAIHERSGRASGPFVTFDCGAVSRNLLQSELFGCVAGAFTGAVADRVGAVGQADGGTLFLDEVSELPLDLQPSLLRLVESRQYQRIGSAEMSSADIRIVAATNRDLVRLTEEGRFRRDLYHRLNVMPIRVPALRQCPENILPLAQRFLRQLGATSALPPAQAVMLATYDWPGNIRQLRNAMERFTVTGMLFEQPVGSEDGASAGAASAGDYHQAKQDVLQRFEASYLRGQFAAHEGNLSAAARASGLARNHFRSLLKKHGITLPPARSPGKPKS